MPNPLDEFRSAMVDIGLTPPDEILGDGMLHRYSSSGKRGDDAGWYIFYPDGIPAGCFGDWRVGVQQTWRHVNGCAYTPAEEAAHRARIEVMRRERDAEVAQRHAEAASKAVALWRAGSDAASNPYLKRKQVSAVQTLRQVEADEAAAILGYGPQAKGEVLTGPVLVVPVKVANKVSTVELIDGDGRKHALYGGAKKTGYWAAQPLPEGHGAGLVLLIGEGVATVLSAGEASGHPGVAALSAGNLEAVAKVMRNRYPKATLVVLADLVKQTGAPDAHAIEAACAVAGKLAVPDFGADRTEGATDFNDLAQFKGADAVKRCIALCESPVAEVATLAVADWPEPQPLTVKLAPEPYPLDALPNTIRAAVEEVAGFVRAPLPLVASSALAALSLAWQAHIDVKRADRLQGPVSLDLVTIADSGERKSTCDGLFSKPLRDYEAAETEAAKPLLTDHRAALEAWEAKRAGIKEKLRQLAKNNKPTAMQEAALRDLEREKPEAPKVPRLLYADATPEALAC